MKYHAVAHISQTRIQSCKSVSNPDNVFFFRFPFLVDEGSTNKQKRNVCKEFIKFTCDFWGIGYYCIIGNQLSRIWFHNNLLSLLSVTIMASLKK